MLNSLQSVAIIISIMVGSVACLWTVHRAWPAEQRRRHNDLIGWQIGVIGTMYAVIVGFMLYAVWTDFEEADRNAEAEANSLVNIFRLSRGLSGDQRPKIQSLAREYTEVMLKEEWPEMRDLRFSEASVRIIEALWTTMAKAEMQNVSEQTTRDHILSELSAMTQQRRLRQLQAITGIPGILWTVLIVGAFITILSACLFGNVDFKLHLFQVLMLSLMLSLALVAIADISRPFQGFVRVASSGFERARVTIENMDAARR